nr:MAG TPA: hypothetical protein [Caudoviricetes sp.]
MTQKHHEIAVSYRFLHKFIFVFRPVGRSDRLFY